MFLGQNFDELVLQVLAQGLLHFGFLLGTSLQLFKGGLKDGERHKDS